MPLLNPSLQREIQKALGDMVSPVTLVVFMTDTDKRACEMCDDTRQLVEELAWLSGGKITSEVYDLTRDAERARACGVDKAPAVVVLGGHGAGVDYGIRFFGIPSGYEFASLIHDIRMVSTGSPELGQPMIDTLARLRTPLHFQVFVTPTCPYCPRAVTLAHKLALASPLVTADMIDASEFPDLADRYDVRGVPRTVINDSVHIEGAVPEDVLLEELQPLLGAV